jgi:ABC-type transport system involved in cytochrome bd biosynthesis fused ATPase/permease subunit
MGEFIRYVSDDNFILDGSIKDNLTCYIQNRKKGEDKDDSELLTLEDTYEMFNLDFIDSLGDALDTPIGNASLSNKQLRLINIARAFIGSPEIVLLNQPFKFLSAHEKNKVSEVLEKLSKNVLILMIGDPYEIQTENTIYLKLDNYNIVPTEKKAAKYKSTFTWKKSKLPSKINKDDRMAVSNIKGAIFKKIERKDNKNES